MSSKLWALAKNPLVIFPPLVIILALGWRQYTYAGRNLSLPQGNNLMPGGILSEFDGSGVPMGWRVDSPGTLQYTSSPTDGYAGGKAFKVVVSQYRSGDVTITSPKAEVRPGDSYLFKGYYTASTPFSLLARLFHSDGSSTLTFVQSYPAAAGDWSTASDAFQAASDVTAVQFVYSSYGDGSLELNSFYLESQVQLRIPPVYSGTNLIPNPQLAVGDNDSPSAWSTYHSGTNTAAFSYLQDPAGSYVEAQVSAYANGEAKWQYPQQPVEPHQYFQLTVTYQSDTPVPIVAEYETTTGKRLYQTVATVQPAGEWTTVSYPFEVPADAVNMFVSLPLQHDGTLGTRDYRLINITKPKATHWPGPIVSVTFDGGKQSQYENALPILQHDGFKATFYINPSTIETRGYMTAAELTDLAGSGDEIGGRGYNPDDMTAINARTLDYELHEGRDYLRAAGYQVSDLAAPFGRTDSQVQYAARMYYTTLRGTESGINTWQNLDPYNLKIFNVSSKTTPQSLSAALAGVKAQGGWLILVYQDIGNAGNDRPVPTVQTNVDTAAFTQQMNLIKKSGLSVAPVSSAYGAIQPK